MADAPSALQTLERDLRDIFCSRLRSLVQYGAQEHGAGHGHHEHTHHGHHHHHEPVLLHTLVVTDTLTPDDLRACAKRLSGWHDAEIATPLILPKAELERSLDVFPFEFSAIIADHVVVSGTNPFQALRVEPSDLRWACEVQARGHLLHLRQGYVEARGREDALSVLVVRSAAAWKSLLENIGRLENKPPELDEVSSLVGVKEISNEDALRIFPTYLAAAERLTEKIDRWGAK